jgi:hypothetical protein
MSNDKNATKVVGGANRELDRPCEYSILDDANIKPKG